MNTWKPIETSPIKPFNEKEWYMGRSPELLLWNGYFHALGAHQYTRNGKGRWIANGRVFHPTHWMPLPDGPEDKP